MTSVDEGDTGSINTRRSWAPRGLSTRFGALFGSRSSSINEPQIELDEPYKQYSRGEIVKGRVVLNVSRPLGITHLTVSLFGYLEVFKRHAKNKSSLRTNPVKVASGKGKRWVAEYYGDGFASLFEHETTLCGEGRLDPNIYHFEFEVPFPSDRDLPSSIEVSATNLAAFPQVLIGGAVRAWHCRIWRRCDRDTSYYNSSHGHCKPSRAISSNYRYWETSRAESTSGHCRAGSSPLQAETGAAAHVCFWRG